jgi:hypothetical protein
MKTSSAVAAALMLGALITTTAVSAQEATSWPELMAEACDADRDGMVTRKEYLDHMARLWDEGHASMMKRDSTAKAGMMSAKQFQAFSLSKILGRTTGN